MDNKPTPTLLTAEPSQEERKERKDRDMDCTRFQIVLDICFEHYTSWDTKPDLANYCRMLVQISQDYEGVILKKIPNRGRDRLIGEMINKAVLHDQKRDSAGKTKVSNEQVFRSLIASLVEAAHQDGLPKSKTGEDSAYKFVSDLLYKYGVRSKSGKPYAASTISNWCDDVKNTPPREDPLIW